MILRQELFKRLQRVEEDLDVKIRLETREHFEGTKCNSNFGLMIIVCELLWVFGVQFGREILVRMDL